LSAVPDVVRVVPDLPTFAVDDGFVYAVPEGIEAPVGSIVRVPLGGRRVRGWVVADGEAPRPGLREVLARSGDLPVFTPRLLGVLRWAALHYVAPVAALLSKATPPNLPRRGPDVVLPGVPAALVSPLPEVTEAAAAGGHTASRYLVGGGLGEEELAGLAGPVLAAGRSVLVVVASLAEAAGTVEALGARFGERVMLASSSLGAAATTTAWVKAATAPGRVLVGTREAAFWPVAGLALACVVEEGRRAMKDRATPTTHVREILWRRASVERFPLVFFGPVPTSEAVYRGTVPVQHGGRPWGLVEVVDRTEDPPGRGMLTERARQALGGVVRSGGRAFVFTDRRAAAVRCVRCRTLRACPGCGARPDRSPACARCGMVLGACPGCGGGRFEPLGAPVERIVAEAAGVLGAEAVGEPGSGRPVLVGTERDIPGLPPLDLAVVVDGDGPLRAPHYRAVEDGLRLMARVVVAAGGGRGRRAIVQTADPGHEAFEALRRADPLSFIEAEIRQRAAVGFPPAGELLVVEATGASPQADADLRLAVGTGVAAHGPSDRGDRRRWLLQARDLRAARLALRKLVQHWRDGGARVRIDADPVDL